MTKTRFEIITTLRQHLGPSEQTEHLIDWVHDLWETKDFLFQRLGIDLTLVVIEAVPSRSSAPPLHDLVLYRSASHELNSSLLN